MAEEAVNPDEVFRSMAESLIEGQSFYKVPQKNDKIPDPVEGVRPNKDIFYRTMPLYSKKPPNPVMPRRCSCQYLCTGAVAVIKCLSCAAMDVKGVGYYCQLCFTARHPHYRVPHVWSEIEKDETVSPNKKNAYFKIEMQRVENEGRDLMRRIDKQREKLRILDTDVKTDDELRNAGRKMVSVEVMLRSLRRQLRVDIRSKDHEHAVMDKIMKEKEDEIIRNSIKYGIPIPVRSSSRDTAIHEAYMRPVDLPVNEDEACAIIQKYFRGWIMRKLLSLLYCTKIITRIWDPQAKRAFYFNKRSGKSMWTPPHFVLKEHLHYIADHKSDEDNNSNAKLSENAIVLRNSKAKSSSSNDVYAPVVYTSDTGSSGASSVTQGIHTIAELTNKKKIAMWCCKLIRLGKR
jgi:hypothetical protein